ncbi:MAG: VRR-NUC domain-containing protein [Actinomycetota bacterium]|nr:VRR-NUC domain-containing protein [Actinomycetota bacterium]
MTAAITKHLAGKLTTGHLAEARNARLATLNAHQAARAMAMSEKELQDAVLKRCRINYRYLSIHIQDPLRSAPGFPDIFIVGNSGSRFWEFKTEIGEVTPNQAMWILRLNQAGHIAAVIRPTDLLSGRVDAELRSIRRSARTAPVIDINPYTEEN